MYSAANDPETGNDPQIAPQMIVNRKCTRCIKSFFLLFLYTHRINRSQQPELFTEQIGLITDLDAILPARQSGQKLAIAVIRPIAGIVMVFTLPKLNNDFVIEKRNTLRPSLKMTIPQLLLTTSKSLDITSKSKRTEEKNLSQLSINVTVESEKLMLYLLQFFEVYLL